MQERHRHCCHGQSLIRPNGFDKFAPDGHNATAVPLNMFALPCHFIWLIVPIFFMASLCRSYGILSPFSSIYNGHVHVNNNLGNSIIWSVFFFFFFYLVLTLNLNCSIFFTCWWGWSLIDILLFPVCLYSEEFKSAAIFPCWLIRTDVPEAGFPEQKQESVAS